LSHRIRILFSHHINFLKIKNTVPKFGPSDSSVKLSEQQKGLGRDISSSLDDIYSAHKAVFSSPILFPIPSPLSSSKKNRKAALPLVGCRIYSVIYFPANCSHCPCLWALVQKCRNGITDWPDLTQLPSHNPIISSFCHPH
jgi:hypothetical protein